MLKSVAGKPAFSENCTQEKLWIYNSRVENTSISIVGKAEAKPGRKKEVIKPHDRLVLVH
jgi:hypothetical protein